MSRLTFGAAIRRAFDGEEEIRVDLLSPRPSHQPGSEKSHDRTVSCRRRVDTCFRRSESKAVTDAAAAAAVGSGKREEGKQKRER